MVEDYLNSKIPLSEDSEPIQTEGFHNLLERSIAHCIAAEKTIVELTDVIVSMFDDNRLYCCYFLQKGHNRLKLPVNIFQNLYKYLPTDILAQINDYIEAPMTATWFSDDKNNRTNSRLNGEQVTSELIYYWMIALGIPYKYEKWHLNRLITLIKVCNIKNQPQKKRSKFATMRSNAELNAARRKKLNTKG